MLHSEFMTVFEKPFNPAWKETDAREIVVRLYRFGDTVDPYETTDEKIDGVIDSYLFLMNGETDRLIDTMKEYLLQMEDDDEDDSQEYRDCEELLEDLNSFKKTWGEQE